MNRELLWDLFRTCKWAIQRKNLQRVNCWTGWTQEKEYLFVRKRFLRPGTKLCAALLFFVKDQDGDPRLCLGFQVLSKLMGKERYSLPWTIEILDILGNAN